MKIIGKQAEFQDFMVKKTGTIIEKYSGCKIINERGVTRLIKQDYYIVVDDVGVIHHIPCRCLVSINLNVE